MNNFANDYSQANVTDHLNADFDELQNLTIQTHEFDSGHVTWLLACTAVTWLMVSLIHFETTNSFSLASEVNNYNSFLLDTRSRIFL